MENRQIGKSIPRKEGREKVTGAARYVDDLTFPGMIYGVTVRSSAARGKILGIRFGEGIPWKEFTIVTAKDIPGQNCIALLIEDQPCLADPDGALTVDDQMISGEHNVGETEEPRARHFRDGC